MRSRWLILIAVLALAAIGGTVLIAQGGPGRWAGQHRAARMERGPEMGFGPFGHSLRFMTRYLDLTEDQQAQVRQIFQQEREANATERQQQAEQLRTIQQQIHDATLAANFDESTLRQLYSQRSTLLENGFLARQKAMHDIYTLLTPEQQQKFQDLRDMRQAWQGGPGPGGNGPAGPGPNGR